MNKTSRLLHSTHHSLNTWSTMARSLQLNAMGVARDVTVHSTMSPVCGSDVCGEGSYCNWRDGILCWTDNTDMLCVCVCVWKLDRIVGESVGSVHGTRVRLFRAISSKDQRPSVCVSMCLHVSVYMHLIFHMHECSRLRRHTSTWMRHTSKN